VNRNQYLAKALSLSLEMGFLIALPIIIFGVGGKYLDKYLGTNFFVIGGIFLAIISSSILIGKKILEIKKEME
jgi:hypothetical protein